MKKLTPQEQEQRHRKHCMNWRTKNKGYWASYMKNYMLKRNAMIRQKVLGFLGGKCLECGTSDERVLVLDHIKGDGYKYKGNKRKSYNYHYNHLEEMKGVIQLLCCNCNIIKARKNKEYGQHKGFKTGKGGG